jgi:hypothetical protein
MPKALIPDKYTTLATRMTFMKSVLLFAITFIACGFASADDAEDAAGDIPEEITVYGKKTLLNLRFAAERAEAEFFDRFNELNEDDQYDVFCEKISNTRSRIKRKTCWSPFERELDEEATKRAFLTGSMIGVRNEGVIRQKREKQAVLLKNTVLENPDLKKLYFDYGKANITFVTERQRRCADNILCLESKTKETEK